MHWKRKLISFAQDHNETIDVINIVPISLLSISNLIVIHFVGIFHSPFYVTQNCNLLNIWKDAVINLFNIIKKNHINYHDVAINQTTLNKLHDNNIVHTNIIIHVQINKHRSRKYLTFTKHGTNISNLHCKTKQNNGM
jgi:hypothetical protein